MAVASENQHPLGISADTFGVSPITGKAQKFAKVELSRTLDVYKLVVEVNMEPSNRSIMRKDVK